MRKIQRLFLHMHYRWIPLWRLLVQSYISDSFPGGNKSRWDQLYPISLFFLPSKGSCSAKEGGDRGEYCLSLTEMGRLPPSTSGALSNVSLIFGSCFFGPCLSNFYVNNQNDKERVVFWGLSITSLSMMLFNGSSILFLTVRRFYSGLQELEFLVSSISSLGQIRVAEKDRYKNVYRSYGTIWMVCYAIWI